MARACIEWRVLGCSSPRALLLASTIQFRQLQRLLLSTRLTVAYGEGVHWAEGARMLLTQSLLVCFHHSLCQLQCLLSSTHLAVHKGKVTGHSLTVFANILEGEDPIIPEAEACINVRHHRISESIVCSFKDPQD